MASAANLSVQHQVTSLHFRFLCDDDIRYRDDESTTRKWFCKGKTTLYVISDEPPTTNTTTSSSGTTSQQQQQHLPLHLRRSCTVLDVKVEALNEIPSSSNTNGKIDGNNMKKEIRLLPLRTSFHHIDPLQHVLIKPAATYMKEADTLDLKPYTFEADSQSSRGAVGMTTSLRAASIASTLGELRISANLPTRKTKSERTSANEQQTEEAIKAWRTDIVNVCGGNESTKNKIKSIGNVQQQLESRLEDRAQQRRLARINLISKRLAVASGYGDGPSTGGKSPPVTSHNRAFKISISFTIPLEKGSSVQHFAGLHSLTTNRTPHIYSTCGVIGDHEGPRSWIPCCDTASVKSRTTHSISIKVTAPVEEGLSCVGAGDDFGVSECILHENLKSYRQDVDDRSLDLVREHLGLEHLEFIKQSESDYLEICKSVAENDRIADAKKRKRPHIIPMDDSGAGTTFMALNTILATTIWCSHIWTPVPIRSLGFAIGPFKTLEDPEYFGPNAIKDARDDDDDEDSDADGEDVVGNSFQARLNDFLEAARQNGEGIRQVYFASLFERKFIHTTDLDVDKIELTNFSGRWQLLPDSEIKLRPITSDQKEMIKSFDHTVTFASAGVVHRSLSLMRDVLALPNYRTAAFTQIWIPDAVHGGVTSGALHNCPECLVNPFLGGSILNSRLLPPVNSRIPFYSGGRVLQFAQARSAIRGWINAALPIGGNDDVGTGYLLTLIESFIMSLYERGHGGFGEGGAKGSMFHTNRYAANSGLNSPNLDFLPVQNIEEIDLAMGGIAVPIEERHNEQLWRGASNGSESHSSSTDEFHVRQVLIKDVVDALERLTDKDKNVPSPSMGWFGSHLSLTFLSSNATSSSDIGCGAVDLLHPIGGLVYRVLKCDLFRGVVEGRVGITNFLRLIRATFIAAHLDDQGEAELKLPQLKKKQEKIVPKDSVAVSEVDDETALPQPPFVICVNELLKKSGLQHTLFTRVLQNLSGRIKEPYLIGTLVDVERHAEDPRTRNSFVEPEGFPNSYVRGASLFYLKVGVLVEQARDSTSQVAKGIHLQAYAEPIVPKGGVAFGGPITIRVVENEGSFREYVKDIVADGSRRDWGTTFLHAKPVTTTKAQTAASGTIERDTPKQSVASATRASTLGAPIVGNAFTETNFHSGGYQAIELIRLTNLTPLLWVRVDPMGSFGGRISVVQPDACLAEQLFHDGDAGAQVDAIRALSERPLRIQGSMKVNTVYDVNVSELPLRVLGDCFRGSPALHSSLPHTPSVRCQAALASAIWQNNKAPPSKDAVGADCWVGINILVQYFRERFYSNSVVMPVKFSRLVMKKLDTEAAQTTSTAEGAALTAAQPTFDALYLYLDALDQGEEIADALDDAEEVEMEEDEEYRVRSAVTTAIASIRAKDGMTPPLAIQFLETVLESEDAEMVSNLVFPDEEVMVEKNRKKVRTEKEENVNAARGNDDENELPSSRSFVSSSLVADSLLALCHVNSMPALITDPVTGKPVQSSGTHPLSRLLNVAKSWLHWELYREKVRMTQSSQTMTGISGNCYDVAAACAVTGLSTLSISILSTTDTWSISKAVNASGLRLDAKGGSIDGMEGNVASAQYYLNIFDEMPRRNDLTRAACAQAITCICCAADRFEDESGQYVGLLCSLEFLLDRIIEPDTSPCLRHTLALIMMDACTGRVCSMQRVGAIAGRNDLVMAANRFLNGPLGASYGGDNGAALLMSVSATSFPSACAVNDGARRGLPLLMKAGYPKESVSEVLIVRVARFATRLWRTINGEPADLQADAQCYAHMGVCAYDGILRCSLLALWQCVWAKGCYAVLRVQAWKVHETTQRYHDMGAHHVMKISDEEKEAANEEEASLADVNRIVQMELDRQLWRGEMAGKAYELYKASKGQGPMGDVASSEQGIGQPLPPIDRDQAYKQGGWIASAALQRRALALDGGSAVSKVRITVKTSS